MSGFVLKTDAKFNEITSKFSILKSKEGYYITFIGDPTFEEFISEIKSLGLVLELTKRSEKNMATKKKTAKKKTAKKSKK